MFQHLRLPAKLALLVTLAALPLLLFAGLWLARQSDAIRMAHNEHDGAQVAADMLELATATQALHGQSQLLLAGRADARAPRDAARQHLTQALARSTAALAERPYWALDAEGQRWLVR